MTIMANDANVESVYDAQYATIAVANDVINGMQDSKIPDKKLIDRILGEASFIRALSYFNLVRMFGMVPLYTEPVDNFMSSHKARAEVKEVYDLIISDLEISYKNLPDVDGNAIGRPHKYAAKAFLAKVYLTMAGDDASSPYWQEAYDAGKEVYDAASYKLVRPFSSVLGANYKNNKESIFEIQFAALQGGSRLTEMTFPLGFGALPNSVGGNQWGKTRPTKSAFDLFSETDPRREITFAHTQYENILESNPKRKNVLLYPGMKNPASFYRQGDSEYAAYIKFADPSFTTVSNCNFVYYRYADLLLVLAEAANELGLTEESLKYINEVLDRARDVNGDGSIDAETEIYPLAVESSVSKDELTQIILKERLLELAGEADEWYTLRRRGPKMLKSVLDIHNARLKELYPNGALPRFVHEIPASEEDVKRNLLLPFPANEIGRNSSISDTDQNYGY